LPTDDEKLKRLAFAFGGAALGAFLLHSHNEESRKSRAEKDDPDGVEALCIAVGELLDEWTPRGFPREDDYSDDLCEFLTEKLPSALGQEPDDDDEDEDDDDNDEDEGEDDGDEESEDDAEEDEDLVICRPSTPYGTPDILIDDRLVLELKVNPNKAERDRLIGQCCGYSKEWVTWAVVIDMPKDSVRELETLLKSKSLHYIEVIPFN
jgi:hypothetical protein